MNKYGQFTAYLAGDVEASKRVELDLPETGVCSINLKIQVLIVVNIGIRDL